MQTPPPVAIVLMGTKNGESFVGPQTQSIREQTGVFVDLFMSDDGSTDTTCAIVEMDFPSDNLTLTRQESPLGLPGNFLFLLEKASSEYDMYAFADQDDVWHQDKFQAAWASIQKFPANHPVLWLSRLRVMNMTTNTEFNHPNVVQLPSFENALVDSIGPGCAMVWNKALQEQIKVPNPEECLMHDSWMYISGTILGTVVWDESCYTNYRLHDNNMVGIDNRFLTRIRRQLKASWGSAVSIESQSCAVVRLYREEMTPQQLEIARTLASGTRWEKYRKWKEGGLKRQYKKDNRLLGARFLLWP